MSNTSKRWKNFWDRRRQLQKAEKLRHLHERTRTLDQAQESFWKRPAG